MVTTGCAPRDTAFWSADDYQPVNFNGDFGSFRAHVRVFRRRFGLLLLAPPLV